MTTVVVFSRNSLGVARKLASDLPTSAAAWPFVLLLLTLCTVLPSVHARDAEAAPASALERVKTLRDNATKARGGEVYTALRMLWQEWDKSDPTLIHEALIGLAEGPGLAPPARTYAGLLAAYAQRRRGDLTGSRASIAKLGFIDKWLILGPFDNEGKSGLLREELPERERRDAFENKAYPGKERAVRYRPLPPAFNNGWIDFSSLLRPQENICAFATTYVTAAQTGAPSRQVSLWAGSSGAMRIYWNGEEVIRDEKYRALDADRFSAQVTLRPGWNRVLVKVCGDEDAPIFSLRIGKPDGSPDPQISIDADGAHAATALPEPADSAKAAGAKGGAAPRSASAKTPVMGGPIPEFEKRAHSTDAAALEAYARYLETTQSDDPAEHLARELATKAAERTPTIPRLLLAGELAENRNQRGAWIEKAEKLLTANTSRDDRIAVLLARGSHARGGPNWRDGIPYYDRVLALDPDNLSATLTRVELYGEAGLRETALTVVERALLRHPRSVSLLREYTTQLRAAGRIREAGEAMDRYAQLRMDDPSFVRTNLDLALARRDEPEVLRWAERLVSLAPDSAAGLTTAARAHISLGRRAEGIALYKRALELAPDDTDSMRALAEVYAVGGNKDEQLRLLNRVLELKPQDKDVREYLAHATTARPKADEGYAISKDTFLAWRNKPAEGQARRTLVDLQVTSVFPNGLASRFHQIVFQPLTDAAAAEGREYAFGYEADAQTVQLRGARIYRKNGQVEEATETGETDSDDPGMAMYSSSRVAYVHFPRLFPGDVVEVLYRIEDVAERNVFADYFGEVRYLQGRDAIMHADYVLITPKSRQFHMNKPTLPSLKTSVTEQRDERVYRYTATDVPALQGEPLQPPGAELFAHVHVSTYKSWDEMGRWYWGLVKDQFVADDEVRRRVLEITKGLTTDAAKVRAVYGFVVQKTRYVALEFGIHGYKPYRCAQIFARGFGDCKDKATLIVTMLKELGIPATIVIVRTRHKGDFESEPASLAPFDHAIAYVPSMNLYLDGTAEYTGSTELPQMDRGALAVQINEGKPQLVHLPDPPASESVLSLRTEATLSADGAATVDWSARVTGMNASGFRQRYHAASAQKTRITEDLNSALPSFEPDSVDTSDLENVEEAVRLHTKGKAKSLARRDGDKFSVPVGPRDHFVRDYAALGARKRDLWLPGRTTTDDEWIVKLPAGAKVQESPKAASGQSVYGSYAVLVENTGGTVRVRTHVAFDKTRISAAEYPAFRAFCEEVDRALGQRLVYGAR